MTFENYLEQQRFRESTINGHIEDLRRFKKWCRNEDLNYKEIDYNKLLKFIQSMQKRQVSKTSINHHLNSLSKYFNYLVKQGERKENPAKFLRLKNPRKRVFKNLLSSDELDTIYQTYLNRPVWDFKGEYSVKAHQRNCAILGLLIYQGVRVTELKKIEKSHLNLHQGTVYIPSSARSNTRILKLNSNQIIYLQEYLFAEKNGQDKERETLFISEKMSIYMMWLLKSIKKQNPSLQIREIIQIRQSVIMNWLKISNIRQVQYMAGHRYISSTERYKEEDLRDLQAQLNLFHPMQ